MMPMEMAAETSLTWPASSTIPRITLGAFVGRDDNAAFAAEVVFELPPALTLVGPVLLDVPCASIVTGGGQLVSVKMCN
eukprot:6636883-Pyramimonas_sp.AAC.1